MLSTKAKYINWTVAQQLIDTDARVAETIALLRGINRSTLEGLTTFYSRLHDFANKKTIHGTGFLLREGDAESADIWLSAQTCWSGHYQVRIIIGTSPSGFGAEGQAIATLELSKEKIDKVNQFLERNWNEGCLKADLMAKHGHKLR